MSDEPYVVTPPGVHPVVLVGAPGSGCAVAVYRIGDRYVAGRVEM